MVDAIQLTPCQIIHDSQEQKTSFPLFSQNFKVSTLPPDLASSSKLSAVIFVRVEITGHHNSVAESSSR